MSTTLELVNQTLRRTGQQDITTLVNLETPARQALACLNQIYFEMLQLLRLSRLLKTALLSTQAGIQAYSLAPDAAIESLLGDSLLDVSAGTQLAEVDYGYPLRAGANASGRPRYFWRQDTRVYFYPTPDAAYSVQYQYTLAPEPLVSDTQTTHLPSAYEPVLVQGAVSLLEKFLGESGYQDSYIAYREGLALLRAQSPLKPSYRQRGYYRGASQ